MNKYKLFEIIFIIMLVLFIFGCDSKLVNYNPDLTNQAKNQLNGPNNIALMGQADSLIKGNWFGISSSQKNCYFSFKEDGSYEYALYKDSVFQDVLEYETGTYFLLGNNQVMFVSDIVTSLPDNIFFNMDEYGRKITFFNNPDQNYISSYDIYNSKYYQIN